MGRCEGSTPSGLADINFANGPQVAPRVCGAIHGRSLRDRAVRISPSLLSSYFDFFSTPMKLPGGPVRDPSSWMVNTVLSPRQLSMTLLPSTL